MTGKCSKLRSNRPKAMWGSIVGGLINLGVSYLSSRSQAKAMKQQLDTQKELAKEQTLATNQNSLANTLNNYAAAQQSYDNQDYNLKYRNGGRKSILRNSNIIITDGGNAQQIDNDTFILRGGTHEDINETGQTGIGINVGGNQIEAEDGEVAQKKDDALRIFSAQPILDNGMSPAQAILRGYDKDKVFAAQQRFKKDNHIKNDGNKFDNGGVINKIYNSYSTNYKHKTSRGNKLSIIKGKVYLNGKLAYPGYKWFDSGNKVNYSVNKDGSYKIDKIHGKTPLSRRDDSRDLLNDITDFVLNTPNDNKQPLYNTQRKEMRFTKSRMKKEDNYIIPNYLPNVRSIKLNPKVRDINKSVFKNVEIPMNMVDSIYKWTKEANQPIYKGFGLIGETSAGKQPPFTQNVAHINRLPYSSKLVKGRGYYYPTDLANTHHYFISPETDDIVTLMKQGLVVPTDDRGDINYIPRTATYAEGKNKEVDNKLKYTKENNGYSEHPFIHALQYLDKANYGMGENYKNTVKDRGYEFLTDKNVRKRINYLRKNNIYKCGGSIKIKHGNLPRKRYDDGGVAYSSALNEVDVAGSNKRRFDDWTRYMRGNALRFNTPTVSYQKPPYTPEIKPKENILDTPYLGRTSTFNPAIQDYIGLGVDTLAAVGGTLFNNLAYNGLNFDYNLPSYVDESPVALNTTYHNEAQVANVERNRLNTRNSILRNSMSSSSALNRMQTSDTNAMYQQNQLFDDKANKETELRNQNLTNEQQVRARNAAARNQWLQNVATIKNNAITARNQAQLAKANSLSLGLSGLAQAYSNFANSAENRYNNRQNTIAMAASARDPKVASMAVQMGYDFSPEVLARIYKSTDDENLQRLVLGKLSTKDRIKYGII